MSYFKVLWADSGAPAASPLGLSRSRSRRPTEAAGVSRADGRDGKTARSPGPSPAVGSAGEGAEF